MTGEEENASAYGSPLASENAEPPAEEAPGRRWRSARPTSEAVESAERAALSTVASASTPTMRSAAPTDDPIDGPEPAPAGSAGLLPAEAARPAEAIRPTRTAAETLVPSRPAGTAVDSLDDTAAAAPSGVIGSGHGAGADGRAGGGSPTGGGTRRSGGTDDGDGGGSGDDDSGDDPVFSQQLWEVQLLLDYLSGNSTRRLPDKAAAAAAGLDEDWIERICRITWPPGGSVAVQADQEALLIRVKDYLNSMAAPANGASVAFTVLVAQDEGDGRERGRLSRSVRPAGELRVAGASRSRRSLARKAYPDFAGKSAAFRSGMAIIGVAVSIWLLLTCWFTWYLALGNVEVGQLAAAQTRLADLQVKVGAQTTRPLASPAAPPPAAAAAGPTARAMSGMAGVQPATAEFRAGTASSIAAGTSTASVQPGVPYCDEPALLQPVRGFDGRRLTVFASPLQADLCASVDQSTTAVGSAEADLAAWLPFSDDGREQTRQAARSAAWISTLASSILPICYGLLGAAAAVLRLLSRRVRLSLLTPRDMTLALQQLALGAVVGACIGLFVATPGGGAASSGELLGTAKLSGSALSFVAGFGVDAVFSALEALIARLFATAPYAASQAR